ncbi:MAG: hypothetical protein ABI253_08425 [Mycobacterium sp.]
MKERNNLRRGVAAGVATLTGLSAVALGVVGISEHADLTAQRDVTLVAAGTAADAHTDLINAQVAQNSSLFDNDNALQQSIYHWALEPTSNGGLGLANDKLLYPGNPVDPDQSIFNGAFSRFTESNLVSQAMMQVQLDHMLGLNQTLGAGGYETEIANGLYADLSGAGIPATGALHDALAAFEPGGDFTSFSGFVTDLNTLNGALMSSAWSDLLSMFSITS